MYMRQPITAREDHASDPMIDKQIWPACFLVAPRLVPVYKASMQHPISEKIGISLVQSSTLYYPDHEGL
jgi:hypothetical protein